MGGAVLVVGSLHHDIMIEADRLPRPDETAVGRRWYPKFGGKGGNQAVAAARAGAQVRMAGAVGDDGFGAYLRAGLRAGGVDDSAVATLPGIGSGMSVAVLIPGGDYAATIVSGANLAIPAAVVGDPGLWDGVAVLILQNEIGEETNIAAAQAARAHGAEVILNAAPARPLPDALARCTDILVVNAVEAEQMGAPPVTDLAGAGAAAALLSAAGGTVIVTAGARGMAAAEAGRVTLSLPAPRVTAVSTHGAGDCFVGTLAARRAAGAPLADACAAAVAAAAALVAGG